MQDYQALALSYAEELSDLKRRHANLERHCRGLESKLSKTRDRMKMYRERCKAWESALGDMNELYISFLHEADRTGVAKAFGVSVCMANTRKKVAPTYPSADCEELRSELLNRTTKPVVVFNEATLLPEVDKPE